MDVYNFKSYLIYCHTVSWLVNTGEEPPVVSNFIQTTSEYH